MSGPSLLQTALLSWYLAHSRDLPFRNTRDPYAIWVSEIMAQQTRITALLPYFERFMRIFPDVGALAAADEHDVLKAWEGLGYYSRARCLRRAAQIVAREHGGVVPDDPAALRRLPGVGDYTAGAILSIAYGRREPAVDGNVLRVHARIANDDTDVTRPEAKQKARAWVYDLMPEEDVPESGGGLAAGRRPGDMTQALMELGALVCLPKTPRCEECPAQSLCAARAAGRERSLPVKSPKKPHRVEIRPVLLLIDPEGRVYMRRRGEVLLCGLWEFPAQAPEGVEILSQTPCGQATHTFTHIKWEMEGFLCRAVQTGQPPEEAVWADAALFGTLAIPAAFRVYVELLRNRFPAFTHPRRRGFSPSVCSDTSDCRRA